MGVDDSTTIIRSEEELTVKKGVRAVRRVRLRKRIVEKEVEVRVVVRHEELEIVEEELAVDELGVVAPEPMSEQILEIILHREEPVVGTRAVPQERVTVTRYVVEERQEVSEDLRKEVVDVQEIPTA